MSGAKDLVVSYESIALVGASMTRLNAYAAQLAPAVAAVATDPDLLASAVLSPGTAARVEVAVAGAAAELGLTILRTEALALVTMSAVVTYEAADAAISAAVPVIVAGAVRTHDAAVDVAMAAVTVVLVLPVLGCGVIEVARSGVVETIASDAERAVAEALADARRQPGGIAALFTSEFLDDIGRHWDEYFSVSQISPLLVEAVQSTLGDTREWSGYTLVLTMLVADGRRLGFFEDGRAVVRRQDPADAARRDRARRALEASEAAVYGGPDTLRRDAENNILPTDVASLFAGASQIDAIGGSRFADIRIIRNVGSDGVTRYVVQIPSTQVWDPRAGAAPNDVTSDLCAMRYGDQTALAQAVRDAMDREHIDDAPVMLAGFSLGGITAAAIAADPGQYNVQQVVTAGAPIGAMRIPAAVHVTSFEATQDLVAALDGRPNPASSSWDTTTMSAQALRTDVGQYAPTMTFGNGTAHDANRYAVMAQRAQSTGSDASRDSWAAIQAFLDPAGDMTVQDYAATRSSGEP